MVVCRGLWLAGTAAAVLLLRVRTARAPPTIEAAKAACERHAEQRTDIP